METAPDAIITLDKSGNIQLASSLARKMFGFSKDEFTGKSIRTLLYRATDKLERHFQKYFFDNFNLDSVGKAFTIYLKKKDGSPFPAEVSFAPLRTPEGSFISAIIRDVSERKKLELDLKNALRDLANTNNKLRRLSEIDHLTEALNRRGFEQILDRESERASRDGTILSIAMMDLDNLKMLNEKFGHSAGDTVLKEIAQRAIRTLRSTDYLARVGGDEFMILFPSTDVNEAASVTERIRFQIGSSEILPSTISTVSCGVIQLPVKVHTLEEILPLLRNTLEKSKKSGKNCVSIGSAQGSPACVKRFSLSEMNTILEHELTPSKDNIYSLDENTVKGIEFQVQGPKDLHTPAELLQAASEMNMLSQVDLVCAQICAKSAESISNHLPVHINILPSTLESVPSERLIEILSNVIKERVVCMELSVLRISTEPGYLVEPLKILKDQGIQIALDDVCYGRSSLEALIVLEPTFIKLERHFVNGLNRDTRKQNAMKRLLKMARVVNAEIIAEGIETVEDFEILKYLGVTLGQGLLFQCQ